jgi:hypothetical protein
VLISLLNELMSSADNIEFVFIIELFGDFLAKQIASSSRAIAEVIDIAFWVTPK